MNYATKKISINLPEWQIEFLDKYAEYSGMSRTSVIAMLIMGLVKDNNEPFNLLKDEVSNIFFGDVSESKKQEKRTKSTKPQVNRIDSINKPTKTEQSEESVFPMKINPMVFSEQPSEEFTDNNVSENGKQENSTKSTEPQDNEIDSLNKSTKTEQSNGLVIPTTVNPMVIKPDIAKPKTFSPKK